jgi:arylsulfatase A-like enzyme
MGWGDLSCFGRPDYTTPNLDHLAKEGMRFTNAYSAAPVCTPTRVGWLTGRYPARFCLSGSRSPITERSELGEKIKTTGIPHELQPSRRLLKKAGIQLPWSVNGISATCPILGRCIMVSMSISGS